MDLVISMIWLIVFWFFSVFLAYFSFVVSGWRIFYFHSPCVSLFLGTVFFINFGVLVDIYFYNSRYDFLYEDIFLGSSILFIGIFLGVMFSNFLFGKDVTRTWTAYKSSYRPSKISLSIGVFCIFFLYYKMPVIPIFSDDVHFHRVNSLRGLGYIYKISLFLIYIGLFGVFYKLLKERRYFYAIFLLVFFSALIMPTANRIDAAFVFFIFILSLLYIKNEEGKVGFFGLICFFVGSVLILFLSAIFQYIRHYGIDGFLNAESSEVFSFSLGGLFHRFWVQLENLSYIYRGTDLEWYETFLNDFLMAVPGSGVNFTSGVLLKNSLGLEFSGGGITPTFIGEGMVSFKEFWYLYVFIIGVFSGFVSKFFTRFFGFSSISFPFLVVSGFMFYAVSTTTFFAVIVHSIVPAFICYLIYVFCFVIDNSIKKIGYYK